MARREKEQGLYCQTEKRGSERKKREIRRDEEGGRGERRHTGWQRMSRKGLGWGWGEEKVERAG